MHLIKEKNALERRQGQESRVKLNRREGPLARLEPLKAVADKVAHERVKLVQPGESQSEKKKISHTH